MLSNGQAVSHTEPIVSVNDNRIELMTVTPDLPRSQSAVCPHCRKPLKLVPIVYGYPAPETFDAADRGELVVAGCLVGDNDPQWACASCGEPVSR
jgi:hypothetical protein